MEEYIIHSGAVEKCIIYSGGQCKSAFYTVLNQDAHVCALFNY